MTHSIGVPDGFRLCLDLTWPYHTLKPDTHSNRVPDGFRLCLDLTWPYYTRKPDTRSNRDTGNSGVTHDARQPDWLRSLSAEHICQESLDRQFFITFHAAQKDRLSQVSQRRKWNNTTRHIIHTIRNTSLKPQSHQAYDHVTTYLWPINVPIVEGTYDCYQRSWVIARGKSVATRSWPWSKPSHIGLTTRLRPRCDRKMLQ